VGGVSPLVESSPWINLGRRSAAKRKYSLSEEKPKKSDIRQVSWCTFTLVYRDTAFLQLRYCAFIFYAIATVLPDGRKFKY
jgi:hypothetical protein